MKLKDIADMHVFLADRCYCPGEIYDLSGFFYQIFHGDDVCDLLCEGERGSVHGIFVVVENQIIYFEITDDKIDSAVRFDATDNNKDQVLKFMNGEIEKMKFDEFKETRTSEELDKVMKSADAIIVS